MASFVKDKLSGTSSTVDSGERDKYLLAVSAATSYDDDTSRQVVINGPPCEVSSRVKVAVRIKEYQGLPLGSPPTSSYFEDSAHSKDTYSIAVSWIPDAEIDAEDLVWGMELINPIGDRIPKRFITTAFDIVKGFIDPSLKCDPYAEKPWLNGPILCSSAITWSVGEKDQCEVPDVLSEGASGSGASVRKEHDIPSEEEKRRKHFSDTETRKKFKFEKGRCYSFDFHNGYIDWKNYALKLPGFSFGVLKYINERSHTLRFVLKNRKSGELCVATTFRLLFGNELDQAIEADKHKETKSGQNSKIAGIGGSTQSQSTGNGSKQDNNKSKDLNKSESDQSRHEDTVGKEAASDNREKQKNDDSKDDVKNEKVHNEKRKEELETRSSKDTTEEHPGVIHDDQQDEDKNHLNIAFEKSVTIDEKQSQDANVKNGNNQKSSIEDSLIATATEDSRRQ